MSAEEIGLSVPAGKAILNADNPWPGLLAFRETDEGYFQGRRTETEDLFRIVLRERLVVLFGLSGLGKSSLLQAGLFPLLRPRNFLPVYIRLDFSPGGANLAEQVKAVVKHEASVHNIEAPRTNADETLWEYFHRDGNTFWNRRNRPVIPVLVFDQFEEIFTLGRMDQVRAGATEAFLDQLADIAEGRPPAALKAWIDEHPGEAGVFDFNRHHYKILLSIREDFLPDLESLRARMPALALNRLRLRRMNGRAAFEVVSQAEHLIDSEVAVQVVRFVAADKRGAPLSDLEVEPALLSVVCRELNEKRLNLGEARITAGLLEGSQEQVLTDFYERSTADLPQEVCWFIEDRLLTVSGYRDSVALENALSAPGMSRHAIDELVERRLTRREERGGVERLELTHDLLAGVVRERREARRLKEEADKERLALLRVQEEQRLELEKAREREKRERERRDLKRFRVAAGLLALIGLIAVAAMVQAQRAERRAKASRIYAEQKADEALKAKAKAETARKEAGDSAVAAKKAAEAAEDARREAEVAAIVSSSREVATAALLKLGTDPELSLLLALAAANLSETPEASDVLHRALNASRVRLSLPVDLGRVDPASVRARNADRTEIWVNHMGSQIAMFHHSGKLTTWDLSGPSPRRSEKSVSEYYSAAAFTEDGKMLAVAIRGQGISLWSVAEGRVVGELQAEGANHDLQKVAFSPDGRLLAVARCGTPFRAGVGCRNPLIDVWDIPGRKRAVQDWPALDGGEVHALAWSSDSCLAAGGSLITEGNHGRIAIWRNVAANAPQPISFTDKQSGDITGLAFTAGCQLIYSGDRSNQVQMLDPAYARTAKTWTGHTGGLRALSRSANGTLLATGSADHTARIWDVRTNQERFPLLGHKDEVRKVAFSGDGKRLATLGLDDTLKIWNLAPNGELGSWTEPEGNGLIALSGDGRVMITSIPSRSLNAPIRVVDLVSGSANRHSELGGRCALSGDGRLLACDQRAVLVIEDRIAGRKLASIDERFASSLHFAGNRRLLIIKGNGPRVWELEPRREVKLASGTQGVALTSGAISPNGDFIALRNENEEVTVWNLGTGSPSKMASLASGSVDLVFSPDNKLLAGSAPDGNIVVWEAGSGAVKRNFSGHSGPVTALAFSADSKLLATGGADKVTRIWNAATFEEQLSVSGHTEAIRRVAFSPDGKRLTTVTGSGEALVYTLNLQDLLALARTRVTRALTPAECRRFLHDDRCSARSLGNAGTGHKQGH